jgi:hypothetical protein
MFQTHQSRLKFNFASCHVIPRLIVAAQEAPKISHRVCRFSATLIWVAVERMVRKSADVGPTRRKD